MKVASIAEAKNRLSALLARVRRGETVLITHRGEPVARLEPVLASDLDDEVRLKRLERQGLVRRKRLPRRPNPLILTPGPKTLDGSSIVDVLLEERRQGR